jgi:ABC-type antimicrobial peptide transport system permease subunit
VGFRSRDHRVHRHRRRQCRATLVSAFSTLALVLAGVGIFGVTAYAVSQRMREFGIRFALGAQRAHVGGIVLRRVAVLAVLGIAASAALGFGLGTLMSGLLFGVTPGDPATFSAALGTIGATRLCDDAGAALSGGGRRPGHHSEGGITTARAFVPSERITRAAMLKKCERSCLAVT